MTVLGNLMTSSFYVENPQYLDASDAGTIIDQVTAAAAAAASSVTTATAQATSASDSAVAAANSVNAATTQASNAQASANEAAAIADTFTASLSLDRAPNHGDDITHDYAVGDLWNFPSEQHLFKNVRNTAAVSAWLPQPSLSSRVGDIYPGLQAVWSTRREVTGYSIGGNLFRVKRSSDNTTLDIPCKADDEADWSAVDDFQGTSLDGQIDTIYDQSGSALNLTLATQGNPGFTVPLYAAANGRRGFMLDGFGNYGKNGCLQNSSLSIPRANFSLTIVGRLAAVGERAVLAALGGSDTFLWCPGDGGSVNGGVPLSLTASRGATNAIMNGGVADAISIVILNSTASGLSVIVNDTVVSTTALPAATLSSLFIGDAPVVATSAFQMLADVYAIYLGSGLSSSDIANVKAAVCSQWDVLPQLRNKLTIIGDSITADATQQSRTWTRLLGEQLPKPHAIYNLGCPGLSQSDFLASGFTSGLAAAVQGSNNTVLVFLGTNQIANGVSAATAFANLQTLTAQLLTANPNIKLAVATMLPRGDATVEIQRQLYNTAIRNAYANVVDVGDDAVIGQFGQNLDTTNYNSDGIHPNTNGSAILAGIAYRDLLSLLLS